MEKDEVCSFCFSTFDKDLHEKQLLHCGKMVYNICQKCVLKNKFTIITPLKELTTSGSPTVNGSDSREGLQINNSRIFISSPLGLEKTKYSSEFFPKSADYSPNKDYTGCSACNRNYIIKKPFLHRHNVYKSCSRKSAMTTPKVVEEGRIFRPKSTSNATLSPTSEKKLFNYMSLRKRKLNTFIHSNDKQLKLQANIHQFNKVSEIPKEQISVSEENLSKTNSFIKRKFNFHQVNHKNRRMNKPNLKNIRSLNVTLPDNSQLQKLDQILDLNLQKTPEKTTENMLTEDYSLKNAQTTNTKIGKPKNACTAHPEKELKFICKTDKEALCSECLYSHFHQHHQILLISDISEEVLKTIEKTLIPYERQIKEQDNETRKLEEALDEIEKQRKIYERNEELKLNQLKSYLDSKFKSNIDAYNSHIAGELNILRKGLKNNHLSKNAVKQDSQVLNQIKNALVEADYGDILEKVQTTTDLSLKILRAESKIKDFNDTAILDKIREVQSSFQINLEEEMRHIDEEMKGREIESESSEKRNEDDDLDFDFEKAANCEEEKESLKLNLTSFKEERKNSPTNFSRQSSKKSEVLVETEREDSVPLKIKMRLVRWFSRNILEYELMEKRWTHAKSDLKKPILLFSQFVYWPTTEIMVMGGLDNKIPNQPLFSNLVILFTENENPSPQEQVYLHRHLASMNEKRASFPAVCNNSYVYVFGGINYMSKIIKLSEKYSINHNKWIELPSLNIERKNSTVCAFHSHLIYIFGGQSMRSVCPLSSFEKYNAEDDTMNLLSIHLPFGLSFPISFKLTEEHILILGGAGRFPPISSKTPKKKLRESDLSTSEHQMTQLDAKNLEYCSQDVWIFVPGKERFLRGPKLSEPVLSYSLPFYYKDCLYLINERFAQPMPQIISYPITEEILFLLAEGTK